MFFLLDAAENQGDTKNMKTNSTINILEVLRIRALERKLKVQGPVVVKHNKSWKV